MDDCLVDVQGCRDAEDEGKDYCCCEGGVVVLVCVAGVFWDVAVFAGVTVIQEGVEEDFDVVILREGVVDDILRGRDGCDGLRGWL